jgi:hypothetical protein
MFRTREEIPICPGYDSTSGTTSVLFCVNELPQTPREGVIDMDKQAGRPLYGPRRSGVLGLEDEVDGGWM